EAQVASAEADSNASEAALKAADEGLRTMEAAIEKDKADLDRMKADLDRAESLFKEQLMAKQDYDLRRFSYQAQQAAVRESETRPTQARAQREQQAATLTSSQRRIAQAKAGLAVVANVLHKHSSFSPIDGMVTNLPVRVGESVVPGLQNQTGTLI